MPDTIKDLSVVISLYNEVESLPELVSRITNVMKAEGYDYEIIMVDDGSRDGSWEKIRELARIDCEAGGEKAAGIGADCGSEANCGSAGEAAADCGSEVNCGSAGEAAADCGSEVCVGGHIRGISFRRNYGKSAALYCGFEAARGEVVVTMDADLQDAPEEIPEMVRMIREEGFDLVSGWKQHRKDNVLTKNLPSKLYNATARMITGIKLHDMNCGLKAYRGEVVKNIEVYGEMHRYIPYLAKNAGFEKIGEKPVRHEKRKYGKSKFGVNRFVNGFLDLLSLWFLSIFGKKPMHLFGLIGSLMFLAGAVISVWLIIDKLISQANGLKFRPVTDQPLFYLALLAVVIGVQLFLSGFIGELISRNSQERNHYNIKDRF